MWNKEVRRLTGETHRRIERGNHKKLYNKTFYNLVKMDKLLEGHKVPKQTQAEIENLNMPITIKQIELVILKLLKKGQVQVSLVNSTKH